jgi:hypothetical protein
MVPDFRQALKKVKPTNPAVLEGLLVCQRPNVLRSASSLEAFWALYLSSDRSFADGED